MKARSCRSWPTILICSAGGFGLAVGEAQEEGVRTDLPNYSGSRQVTEQGGAGQVVGTPLVPYSRDIVDIGMADSNDQLVGTSSLEEGGQMSVGQRARMANLLREEREAMVRALAPAGYDVNLLRCALQKGVALDEASLQVMQNSFERVLARLAGVLSFGQLRQFAAFEQQKLDAQRSLLRMRQNWSDERKPSG